MHWQLLSTKTLQYILENFSHAPSRDLEPATLHMLVQLMCGQVVFLLFPLRLPRPQSLSRHESVSMRKQLWLVEKRSWCWLKRLLILVKLTIRWCLKKSFTVSPHPSQVLVAMQQAQDYVPFSWLSLVQVQNKAYPNLSHWPPGETGTLPSPCRPARGSMPSLLCRAFQSES